jgi:hypothetical protein
VVTETFPDSKIQSGESDHLDAFGFFVSKKLNYPFFQAIKSMLALLFIFSFTAKYDSENSASASSSHLGMAGVTH